MMPSEFLLFSAYTFFVMFISLPSFRALLLFGNSLFPDNFRMKLQSYQIAKEAGDVDKAAQLFRAMYLSFPNEQSFYAELCAIIEEVRTEQQSKNTGNEKLIKINAVQCVEV